MRLQNKVAIVTGGARGIGRAIALKLAKEGAKVIISDIDLEGAAETAKMIAELGSQALAFKANVADFQEVSQMVDKVLDKFGRVDILINNAGITRDNLLLRMSEEEWDSVIDINLKGAFNCTKAVAKPMLKQRQGRIVNISSVVGIMGNAGQANYSSSKAGLIGLTKSVAKELATRNINVNAVAPGFIATQMTEALSQEMKSNIIKLIPLGRLGEPEDVAGVVLFLVSDEAKYITGQVIQVDGGMVM